MRPVFPYLVAAVAGLSSAALAQDPAPILVVPDPVAVGDTQTVPRIIPVEALPLEEGPLEEGPLDERPLGDDEIIEVPDGAVPFEDFSPEPSLSAGDPAETDPEASGGPGIGGKPAGDGDAPVPSGLDDPGIAVPETIVQPAPAAPADTGAPVGTVTTPSRPQTLSETPVATVVPGSDGRFPDCADDLLKAAYAGLVSETVLQTYAIEAEVLRLCAERQEVVSRILKQELELADLLGALPERTAVAAGDLPERAGNPPETADVSALPDASATAALEAALPPAPPMTVPAGGAAAAVPVGGSWQHLVRYRVRTDGGAWRAGIASTYRPPLPPPVVLEDGTVLPATPPPPEPPLEMVVAAGDELQGGLIVEAITDTAVTVRRAGADGEPRELRNDPGDAPGRYGGGMVCAAGAAQGAGGGSAGGRAADFDARDFIYCTVTTQ